MAPCLPSQETFYADFQDVLSSKLVPVSVVLVIAMLLQLINIVITYCVIHVSKKVRVQMWGSDWRGCVLLQAESLLLVDMV